MIFQAIVISIKEKYYEEVAKSKLSYKTVNKLQRIVQNYN